MKKKKLGFWDELTAPVVGMAPMDGVTDAAFRHMVCKYSRPSFVMTEFVNVEGLARGVVKKLPAFLYDEIERPIVAQVFGTEVDSFYKAAVLVCELGFDGIDINMGCPARKVEKKGSGAGLIRRPELAKDIIWAVKRGVKDWMNGISLEKVGIYSEIIQECGKILKGKKREAKAAAKSGRYVPVSVKTRIGYDKVGTEEWVGEILRARPDAVLLHGRTLRQMYMGEADWEEIAKAAPLCGSAGVMCFGNGDVKSMEDAEKKIRDYKVDGVLVGRAVMGNPWFFGGEAPVDGEAGREKRLQAALEHIKYYKKLSYGPFHNVKKHLGWYLKGFDGARELRMKVMECENFQDIKKLLL
jgi:tRNA-dihydrouridine synthase